MLPRYFVCLLLISFICECYAQKYINLKTYNADSLLFILPSQQAEERVNSLNNLAVSLSFIDFERSKQYAEKALNLSKEINYDEGKADAFRNYGHIYVYQGLYPKALNNYLEALSLYEITEKQSKAGWVCYEISKIHYFANNYERTIEYCNKALDIFQKRANDGTKVGNIRDSVTIFGGLSETYWKMGMLNKSQEFGLKTLDLMKRNNFRNIELMIATWSVGSGFAEIREPDSAKAYFFKSLTYPDEDLNMQTLKYRNIISLGWLNYYEGEIDSAIYYLQIASEFYNDNGFLYWAMFTFKGLGYIYYKNNELDRAEKCLQHSEKIFNEMLTRNSWYKNDSLKNIANYGLELYFPLPTVLLKEMMWNESRSLYKILYLVNIAKNEINVALKYHIAYSDAKDTLNKLQRNREIMEIQTKYETERKEVQIVSLSQENSFQEFKLKQSRYFLIGFGGLILLVMILATVLIRQNKLREQQKNLLLQQKLFRSQMNPHFIFNSLTSIQNYILDEEAHKASKYLSRFSKLVRHILDSSIDEFVTLKEEISTIENYLELQKIRFKDKFDYTIELDEAINTENIKIPPMLAQPFIENSIEHGIKHKKSKGNIYIRFFSKKTHILFEIEDDGVGREKAKELLYKYNQDHKSLATTITRERIKALNNRLKKKITLSIFDLYNNKKNPSGTKVVLTIPFV